jgi:hypothetical protein
MVPGWDYNLYSVAARHSAKIDVQTGPFGTTFNVRFPLPDTKGYLQQIQCIK